MYVQSHFHHVFGIYHKITCDILVAQTGNAGVNAEAVFVVAMWTMSSMTECVTCKILGGALKKQGHG